MAHRARLGIGRLPAESLGRDERALPREAARVRARVGVDYFSSMYDAAVGP
jgi:hypothetical protein